jgi:hypothetical protein
MDKQLAIRRVRIAMSVFCIVLAAMFAVLWLRSLWRFDQMIWYYAPAAGGHAIFHSVEGHLYLSVRWYPPNSTYEFQKYADRPWGLAVRFKSRTPGHEDLSWDTIDIMHAGFGYCNSDDFKFLAAPCWFFILVTSIVGVVAGLPYLSYRFSLRTLLIATTLAAVVLGLSAWLAR